MKTKSIAASLFFALCSMSALAASGGFHNDEPPPPPDRQQSGFKGSSDATQTTIEQAKRLKDHTWVTLQGNIVQKNGNYKYLLRDHTGNIEVKIDDDKWNGQDVTPKDLVVVSGRLEKDRHADRIDVKQLLKQ